ncbi:GPW/gp25 family protein [Megasphaera elsdenii]|uniref:GPW/gp25 family protein n=1 Tax=Megasphaera elsdenii TaxID=907 RepID=UPI002E76A462|nr:GPW/gp25 family protein [Megasphaera elsdenii]MEE0404149.1 GPW/gp25 family protein [Megasphaera elsdenii]
MLYEVSVKDPEIIDIAPKNDVNEILQNVRTILATTKGTIPLDREFGIDGSVIDMPTMQAQAYLTNEIFQAIRRYEPRVSIDNITFDGEISGKLIPKVVITI